MTFVHLLVRLMGFVIRRNQISLLSKMCLDHLTTMASVWNTMIVDPYTLGSMPDHGRVHTFGTQSLMD